MRSPIRLYTRHAADDAFVKVIAPHPGRRLITHAQEMTPISVVPLPTSTTMEPRGETSGLRRWRRHGLRYQLDFAPAWPLTTARRSTSVLAEGRNRPGAACRKCCSIIWATW